MHPDINCPGYFNTTDMNKQIKPKLWTSDFIFASIANFMLFFSFYLLMPTLPFYLVTHFKVTNATAGLIISGYIAASILIRPFSGFMADTFNRKTIYLVSYTVFVAFYAGYIAAASILLFIIVRAAHGFAFGAVNTTSNTVVVDILPISRQGEGIGYFGLSSTIAMAIGPVIGLIMYDKFPFVILFYGALISGTVGFIFATLVKMPKLEKTTHDEALSFDRFLLLKGLPIGVNFMLLGIPYGMVTTYIAMYGRILGVSGSSGTFFIMMALGLVISRLFSGKHVDKGRIALVIKTGSIIGALSLAALFLTAKVHIHQSLCFYSAALFMGLGYGMIFPSFNIMFVNLAPHNRRATANSTYLISWDLGIAAGIILGGKVIDTINISTVYAFGTLSAAAAAIYFVWVTTSYFQKNKLR